jgi:hypothetical protein
LFDTQESGDGNVTRKKTRIFVKNRSTKQKSLGTQSRTRLPDSIHYINLHCMISCKHVAEG